MKSSAMVKELQKLIEKHGDVAIGTTAIDSFGNEDVKEVRGLVYIDNDWGMVPRGCSDLYPEQRIRPYIRLDIE